MLELLVGEGEALVDESVEGEVSGEDLSGVALGLDGGREDLVADGVGGGSGGGPLAGSQMPGVSASGGSGGFGLVQTHVSESVEVVVVAHLGADDVLGEPDHAAAGDGGESGVAKVLDLEHDADVGRKGESFAVG